MPNRLNTKLFAFTVLISLGTQTGCSTFSAHSESSSRPVAYTESALDLVNRAPASMSLPTDGEDRIDPVVVQAKADYHFSLAETYALEGESARAIEEYRLVLLYDKDSVQVRLRMAQEFVKQGMMGEAVKAARVAAELSPEDSDVQMLLAGLYSSLRLYKEALQVYQGILTRDPEHFDAAMYIGALFAEQKKFPEAIRRFESLAKKSQHASAHVAAYYLGRVYLDGEAEKDAAKAERAFQLSLKLKPSFADAALALASLYDSTEQPQRAEKLLAQYQVTHGPSPAVAEVLAPLYLKREQHKLAIEQYKILEASDPEDYNARLKIAFLHIQMQQYKEAAVRLEALVEQIPTADKVRFYLGAVYEELKNYPAAVPHFLQIDMTSSFFVDSRAHAAHLLKTLGEVEQANSVLRTALESKPDADRLYFMLAANLEDLGQLKESYEVLKNAVTRFPTSAQAHFFMGHVLERMGDTDRAIAAMKTVIGLDSEHSQALNFLAYAYAEKGVQLSEAEQLARRAVKLKADDGFILDTLGWVLFKQGRIAESIRILESAMRLQPTEAIIAEHLGDAYLQFKMPERAKVAYTQALKLAKEQLNTQAATQAQAAGRDSARATEQNALSVVSIDSIQQKLASIERQVDLNPDRIPASMGLDEAGSK